MSLKKNMPHFDAWAAQYGEVVTALELAPEVRATDTEHGLQSSKICPNYSVCIIILPML